MKKLSLVGKRFHGLVVLSEAAKNRSGNITWLCKCDCGETKTFSGDHLTRKKSPVKSCGCQMVKAGPRHSQWKGHEEISGNWWYSHVLRERKENRRQQVPVTVTIKQAWKLFVKQDRKCALSGLPITISSTAKYNTASIDRIDSSKGYTKDNIQWVHKDINFMKRTYSQDYFIKMCKFVASTQGGACEIV